MLKCNIVLYVYLKISIKNHLQTFTFGGNVSCVAAVIEDSVFVLGVLKYGVCKGCDGGCVFCLYCDAWSCRCSCMGSMSVSSCSCCMSCVHPVAVLNAAFCILHDLQFVNAGCCLPSCLCTFPYFFASTLCMCVMYLTSFDGLFC